MAPKSSINNNNNSNISNNSNNINNNIDNNNNNNNKDSKHKKGIKNNTRDVNDEVSQVLKNVIGRDSGITKDSGSVSMADRARKTITDTLDDTVASISLDNYVLVLGITLALVLLILLYFLSKSFNVGHTIQKLKMYPKYQQITNANPHSNTKLYQMHITSSYNASHSGHQLFGYTSEHITRQLLRSGARYLEFTIFPSTFGTDAIPMVGAGYKKGQWNLVLNNTSFEAVIRVIAQNAFKISGGDESGSPNPKDPIIIGLNLSTNNNVYCLDRMAEIILDYLHEYVLPPKYAYQHNGQEFGQIPFSAIRRRVVLLSSGGFEGSKLEELINARWYDYNVTGLHLMNLDSSTDASADSSSNSNSTDGSVYDSKANNKIWRIPSFIIDKPWFNQATIRAHNKAGGLTIVIPHVEGDVLTRNYNPQQWWDMGCQMVGMNWQYIDEHMDSYITYFSKKAFIKHS